MAEVYGLTRRSLVELAEGLDADQQEREVAPTPGWRVKDVYGHLAGLAADLIDGRMEGAGSPEWTAEQVRTRTDRPLADVTAEWAVRGPEVEDWIRADPAGRRAFPVYDVWTHEQDVRSTVGLRGVRDDERVPFLLDAALGVFDANIRREGTPATRVVGDTVDRVVGEGDPVATLRSSDYEILRLLFGRRSRAQAEAAGWEGDAARPIEDLHLFEFPTVDIVD